MSFIGIVYSLITVSLNSPVSWQLATAVSLMRGCQGLSDIPSYGSHRTPYLRNHENGAVPWNSGSSRYPGRTKTDMHFHNLHGQCNWLVRTEASLVAMIFYSLYFGREIGILCQRDIQMCLCHNLYGQCDWAS